LPVLTEALRLRDFVRARSQLIAVAGRIVLMQTPIVALFLFAGPFLLGLIGPGFQGAWGVLMVLSVGAWVNGVLGLSELALLSIKPRANPQASAMRLALYAVVLIPLQGMWGPRGVALANALATFTANLVRVFICRPTLRASQTS
jgi:hypothetical protein